MACTVCTLYTVLTVHTVCKLCKTCAHHALCVRPAHSFHATVKSGLGPEELLCMGDLAGQEGQPWHVHYEDSAARAD